MVLCTTAGGAVGAVQALCLATIVAAAGAEEGRDLGVVAPFLGASTALHGAVAALAAPGLWALARVPRLQLAPMRLMAPIVVGTMVAGGGVLEVNLGRWDRSPFSADALLWDLGAVALGLACAGAVAGFARIWRRRRSRPLVAPAAALTGIMALGLVAGRFSGQDARVATDRRPNLLFLAVDTLRADHLSCYGYERPTSPHIDSLAAQGAIFSQAAAHSSATGPSHASLLTSTPLIDHGVLRNGDRLGARRVSLAEVLRAHGYACAGFSTNGVIGLDAAFDQGFQSYFASRSKHAIHEWDAGKSDPAQWLLRLPLPKLLRRWRGGDVVTDAAVSWLRRRGAEGPFFLWVQWLDPHSPYEPGAAHRGRFSDSALQGQIDGSHATLETVRKRERIPAAEEIEQLVALYDEEIAQVDAEIGRMLEVLEEQGLRESTMVVLWADHGENMYQHHAAHGADSASGGNAFFHSRQLYESLLRVPLIVRWPRRIPAGRRIDAPVATVDIAPTVLDLLELPPAPTFTGVSVAAALPADGQTPARAPIAELYHLDTKSVAIRHASWKLIRSWTSGGVRDEFYDLENDPQELHDLAGTGLAAEAALADSLRAWGDAHGLGGFLRKEISGSDAVPDRELRGMLEALGYL